MGLLEETDCSVFHSVCAPSVQARPRPAREILLLLRQRGLPGEEENRPPELLGQVSPYDRQRISDVYLKRSLSKATLNDVCVCVCVHTFMRVCVCVHAGCST